MKGQKLIKYQGYKGRKWIVWLQCQGWRVSFLHDKRIGRCHCSFVGFFLNTVNRPRQKSWYLSLFLCWTFHTAGRCRWKYWQVPLLFSWDFPPPNMQAHEDTKSESPSIWLTLLAPPTWFPETLLHPWYTRMNFFIGCSSQATALFHNAVLSLVLCTADLGSQYMCRLSETPPSPA